MRTEVRKDPNEYRATASGKKDDDDKGNPEAGWREQKRSNATHRSTTEPDARLAQKGGRDNAQPGYTLNAAMENRSRIPAGINVQLAGSVRDELSEELHGLRRFRRRGLGADG